ncbi:MAG: phage tail sheath C-terminal domain-containing protein, partial [Bacteroidota bacterium]
SYFTFHSQMKVFFANGGTDCYIVSVGHYTKKNVAADGEETEVPNQIELDVLQTGIPPLLKEPEPTMLVIPEAVMVDVDRSKTDESLSKIYQLQQEMLRHCGGDMRNRFAILDVWMDLTKIESGEYDLTKDIDRFRKGIGNNHLSWGAAYYPWLRTTATAASEVSFLNIDNLGEEGDIKVFTENTFNEKGEIIDKTAFKTEFIDRKVNSLVGLLDVALNQEVLDGLLNEARATTIKNEVKKLINFNREEIATAASLNSALLAVSPIYKEIMNDIRARLNLLPPSAAMAGIYAMVDNTIGVFQSPANVSVGSVIKPVINITNEQQEDLNMPLSGKAINAIRSFPGKGTLVWGARTLDGNSQDWRYVSVRRTVIFIEQSIKYAAEPYVFEPNTVATWANIKALITNFLTNVWQSGALAGATPEDAFSVEVGLGTTMTAVDILDGYMRITVKLAVVRPAEFIVITFEQKMQQS